MVARNVVAHPLQAGGVEPGERDGEAVPQLLLELGHHALEGEHQDALAAAAAHQLGDQDAGFQGLAQAHGVGDQDALAILLQRLQGRVELVGHRVHGGLVAQVDAGIRRGDLAPLGLDE